MYSNSRDCRNAQQRSTDSTDYNPINQFSLFHWNARSLNKNFDSLELLLSSLGHFPFSVIGISETWLRLNSPNLFNIDNYKLFRSDREKGKGGGVALYIHNKLRVKVRPDIHVEGCENLFVEIINDKIKNKIIGVFYRPPNNPIDKFLDKLDECLTTVTNENKEVYLMGDYNIDMTNLDIQALRFQNILLSFAFNSHINNPTRISNTSKTLLDNIFSNTINFERFTNGILFYDTSDHLPIFTVSQQSDTVLNTHKSTPQLYRKETHENITMLNENLAQEEWADVVAESETDKAYNIFINKLIYYYNKNIPY